MSFLNKFRQRPSTSTEKTIVNASNASTANNQKRIDYFIDKITKDAAKNGAILTLTNKPKIIGQSSVNNIIEGQDGILQPFKKINNTIIYTIHLKNNVNAFNQNINNRKILKKTLKKIGYYIETSTNYIIYYTCETYPIKLEKKSSPENPFYLLDTSFNNIGYIVPTSSKINEKITNKYKKYFEVEWYGLYTTRFNFDNNKFNLTRNENALKFKDFIGEIILSSKYLKKSQKNLEKKNTLALQQQNKNTNISQTTYREISSNVIKLDTEISALSTDLRSLSDQLSIKMKGKDTELTKLRNTINNQLSQPDYIVNTNNIIPKQQETQKKRDVVELEYTNLQNKFNDEIKKLNADILEKQKEQMNKINEKTKKQETINSYVSNNEKKNQYLQNNQILTPQELNSKKQINLIENITLLNSIQKNNYATALTDAKNQYELIIKLKNMINNWVGKPFLTEVTEIFENSKKIYNNLYSGNEKYETNINKLLKLLKIEASQVSQTKLQAISQAKKQTQATQAAIPTAIPAATQAAIPAVTPAATQAAIPATTQALEKKQTNNLANKQRITANRGFSFLGKQKQVSEQLPAAAGGGRKRKHRKH
jgi:hypothetical protein